jgi:hypothetical protein
VPPCGSIRQYATSKQEGNESEPVNVRATLKQFLLKVHPDLFGSDIEIQTANDKALKQLNQFFDVVEDALERAKKSKGLVVLDKNKVPSKLSILFYIRHSTTAEDDAIPNLYIKPNGQRFLMIRTEYSFPRDMTESAVSSQRVDRESRLFVNELLRQAELPELPVGGGPMGGADEHSVSDEPTPKADAWTKDFKKLLERQFNRHYPVEQHILDSLGGGQQALHMAKFWQSYDDKHLENLHHFRTPAELYKRAMFYAPSLDGEQRGEGMLKVDALIEQKTIPHDIPVLITNDNTYLEPEHFPGFVTIPYNYDRRELLEYLEVNLPLIRQQRKHIRSLTTQAEFFQSQIKTIYKFSRIEVRAGLEDTVKCLRTFVMLGDRFEKYKLVPHFDGLTLIISPEVGNIELDVVRDLLIIPVKTRGVDILKQIKAEAKLLELRTNFNPHHTEYLKEFKTLLKTLRQMIGAKNIIVDMSIINSKKRQLEAAEAIRANADALQKLNLSKIVLSLSDRYGVDFTQKRIHVPFDLNLPDLERYVQKIFKVKSQRNQ